MASSVWVRLEVSKLERRNRYISLDVVDRDEAGNALSKTRAYIWAAQANQIEEKFSAETGRRLSEGIKLLVFVRVKFHSQYGLSLGITDIDPKFTLGDMEAKLRRIRETLAKLGESSMNADLPLPNDVTNVAVISPANAASLGDFRIEADKLVEAGVCRFRYFHALFQGPDAKSSLREAFKCAHVTNALERYDVLVLIRGGGAIDDLHWLNEEILARLVCRMPIPVFVGIGHEKDVTILDEYANRSFGTPSKVIGHIRDLIFSRVSKAWEDWSEIHRKTSQSVVFAEGCIDHAWNKFGLGAFRMLDDGLNRGSTILREIGSRADKRESLADGQVKLLRNSILDGGGSSASLAESSVWDLMAKVNDRANSSLSSLEAKTENGFVSIETMVRRSIDGIDMHIANFSNEVAANSLLIRQLNSRPSMDVLTKACERIRCENT